MREGVGGRRMYILYAPNNTRSLVKIVVKEDIPRVLPLVLLIAATLQHCCNGQLYYVVHVRMCSKF